ncbi:MAG: glutaredoxin 3 [Pseudomonadales bacterium]|nr:glutaredoxin 3 [Pseudomonadales bacterium]MCP5215959.1 glutaredoxin 3 [Pseudomonadales bacterium]
MSALVKIYTTKFCSYCIRARRLLNDKGIEYQDIRVDEDILQMQEMVRLSGRHTVPQIWIGERHVGGYTDLSALDDAGELDALLAVE